MTVEDTASTSPHEAPAQTGEGPTTGLPADVVGLRLSRPGLYIAGVVLIAGLTTGGPQLALSVADWIRRRRDDVAAECSTAAVEVDPLLLREIRELFEQGATEFFHDGVHSNFSRTLLKTLAQHGQVAFRAITEYLFSGSAKPDVVSEALRWLADFNDASTLSQRWAILQRTLRDRSPRVRDGAVLGFAALDDSRARPLLLEARNLEQIGELRTLIEQVVAQLDRPR
ncbi:MAG: HEAT repeat domain-containing protein [Planctomycetota bacterium]